MTFLVPKEYGVVWVLSIIDELTQYYFNKKSVRAIVVFILWCFLGKNIFFSDRIETVYGIPIKRTEINLAGA